MSNEYEFISQKIDDLKRDRIFLRDKNNEFVFTALCVKANFYKNPAFSFDGEELVDTLVDGSYDGGVDAILSDPNSDNNDIVLVQSKFYKDISTDAIQAAVNKMIDFYNRMESGNYETTRIEVQNRYLSLAADVGDESKVVFAFYTSAPKKGIRTKTIEKKFNDTFKDTEKYELRLLFAEDVVEEIKEAEATKALVESDCIDLDRAGNILYYGDDDQFSAIVNVSAFSLKKLYAKYSNVLLSRNLRYFIRKQDIDNAIKETIKDNPDSFWFKNNGITIICDDFDISGKELKMTNFSIINGGQTTRLIHKSDVNEQNNFFLPCKVIKTCGGDENTRQEFILDIAKATNSQKAIKQIDLKSNAPEQIRFGIEMRNIGVYYQLKRGDVVSKNYQEDYLHTDLGSVGKLCLAGIFQLPAKSRNKPNDMYLPMYYNPIFNSDQHKVAAIAKDLLYINYMFQKRFIKEFVKTYRDDRSCEGIIPFATNSRTACISFVALVLRYFQDNINDKKMGEIFSYFERQEGYKTYIYDIVRDIDNVNSLLSIIDGKDVDCVIQQLFEKFINDGFAYFKIKKDQDSSLTPSNFFKDDRSYFYILRSFWAQEKKDLASIKEKYIKGD